LARRFLYKECLQLAYARGTRPEAGAKGGRVAKRPGMVVPIIALTTFVLGGISTFTGLGLLAFMRNRDVLGLGDGRSMGVSLVIMGLIGSIAGVLLMRIFRNRI
jgi:hypothetical protein